jgi:ABC-type Mn2+/Zn2+ transport system permease subunit
VIPGAVAQNLSRRFQTMVWTAAGVAVGSTVGGLALSYGVDFPSGATIVLVLAILYFLTGMLRPWLRSRGRAGLERSRRGPGAK